MILRVMNDGPRPGTVNMVTDARLLAEHCPGDDPILRLYRWSPWAVTYGYHQAPDTFDVAAAADRGWDVVRRPTGGRAILHAQELTYAVVGTSPCALFGDTLHQTYTTINRALMKFLRELGLSPDVSDGESLEEARGAVCFQTAGRHEVTVGGRKIIGSAQRRSGEVFLQHGSILLDALYDQQSSAGGAPSFSSGRGTRALEKGGGRNALRASPCRAIPSPTLPSPSRSAKESEGWGTPRGDSTDL